MAPKRSSLLQIQTLLKRSKKQFGYVHYFIGDFILTKKWIYNWVRKSTDLGHAYSNHPLRSQAKTLEDWGMADLEEIRDFLRSERDHGRFQPVFSAGL